MLGKSAELVASEIIRALGDAPTKGCVLVLQGLSGTGKGTTVSKLEKMLPRCTSWSNGNVFRTLTLLAVTRCEQQGIPFTSEVLTPPFLAELVQCLSFGKFNGTFDIKVEGFGLSLFVSQVHNGQPRPTLPSVVLLRDRPLALTPNNLSQVANTKLKEPKVGKNIPTVAKMTQGEVVAFAAHAADTMRNDGMNVLLEVSADAMLLGAQPAGLTFSSPPSLPSFPTARRGAHRRSTTCAHRTASS